MMTNNVYVLQGQKYTNRVGAVPQSMMGSASDVCSLQMEHHTLSSVSSWSIQEHSVSQWNVLPLSGRSVSVRTLTGLCYNRRDVTLQTAKQHWLFFRIVMQVQQIKANKFKLSIRIGKEGDLSDFEISMIFGSRWAGLSISETADLLYWDFPFWGFTEKGSQNEKFQVGSSSLIKKSLLLFFFIFFKFGNKRMSGLLWTDRRATVSYAEEQYNSVTDGLQ